MSAIVKQSGAGRGTAPWARSIGFGAEALTVTWPLTRDACGALRRLQGNCIWVELRMTDGQRRCPQGLRAALCCKHLTRRTRRSTEQHGALPLGAACFGTEFND